MRTAIVTVSLKSIPYAPKGFHWDPYGPTFITRRGVKLERLMHREYAAAIDLHLSGDGLPLRCQSEPTLHLSLDEVNRGVDDYTALVIGVGAEI